MLNGHFNIISAPEIGTPDKEEDLVEASSKDCEIFANISTPKHYFLLHTTRRHAACQHSATSQSVNQVGETKSVPSMSISVNCLYK